MVRCGLRGGYLELVNLDPLVIPHIYKFFCTIPCGPLSGQIALDVMIDPPQPTQDSYELYTQVGHVTVQSFYFITLFFYPLQTLLNVNSCHCKLDFLRRFSSLGAQ